ncbi:MAG: hypothetical protein AAGC74_06995 [Verrucomicrobiota bacterium]
MRSVLNFLIAFLLLFAFIGSAYFFYTISNDLTLQRVQDEQN